MLKLFLVLTEEPESAETFEATLNTATGRKFESVSDYVYTAFEYEPGTTSPRDIEGLVSQLKLTFPDHDFTLTVKSDKWQNAAVWTSSSVEVSPKLITCNPQSVEEFFK